MSGEAIALREGNVVVNYRTNEQNFKSRVKVVKVADLNLREEGKWPYLTNQPSSKYYEQTYSLQLVLTSLDSTKKTVELLQLADPTGLINNRLVFKCSTAQSQWFIVSSKVEQVSDERQVPACLLRAKPVHKGMKVLFFVLTGLLEPPEQGECRSQREE